VGRLLAGVCGFVLLAPPAAFPATRSVGEPAESGSPVADGPLKKLGWLVGGTWVAEEKAADGSVLVVRLRCRWADTGHAILFRVGFVSNGGAETPQYDGMFVWHPGRNKLTLWQVNRKGEVAEGEVTGSGDEFDQVVRVSHPDGSVHFLKGHYRREKRDAFRFQAFFRTSETAAWRDALDLVYRRPSIGKR
jgi:hypothetical protein